MMWTEIILAILAVGGSLGGVWLGSRVSAKSQGELAGLDREQQRRVAALERRLKAHQKAYQLWTELLQNLNKDEIDDVVVKCQKFWGRNCLFLGERSREEFGWCMHFAPIYRIQDPDKKLEWWERFMEAANVIADEVGLPPIKEPTVSERPDPNSN
jgi:hypothetical protein